MATTKQRITRGNDARDIEMSVQNHGQGGTKIEAGKETGTRGDTATATMSERISRGVSEITETTTADIVTTVRGRTGDLVANVERVGNLTPGHHLGPAHDHLDARHTGSARARAHRKHRCAVPRNLERIDGERIPQPLIQIHSKQLSALSLHHLNLRYARAVEALSRPITLASSLDSLPITIRQST